MIVQKKDTVNNPTYLYGFEDAKEMIINAIQKSHDEYNCSMVAISVCSCQLSIDIARSQSASV
jgi:hypothetical protein